MFVVKKPNIPNVGKGLFTLKSIKKDDPFVEFKGKVTNTGGNKRSTIAFHDGKSLDCYPDCLASYANDPVDLSNFHHKRKLLKTMRKQKPFYKLWKNTDINACIYLDNNHHRAFLQATRDIKEGEEIFVSYGFIYWFLSEMRSGFYPEDELMEKGLPETLTIYPAYINSMKLFYPELEKIEVVDGIQILYLKNNNFIKFRDLNLSKFLLSTTPPEDEEDLPFYKG